MKLPLLRKEKIWANFVVFMTWKSSTSQSDFSNFQNEHLGEYRRKYVNKRVPAGLYP